MRALAKPHFLSYLWILDPFLVCSFYTDDFLFFYYLLEYILPPTSGIYQYTPMLNHWKCFPSQPNIMMHHDGHYSELEFIHIYETNLSHILY